MDNILVFRKIKKIQMTGTHLLINKALDSKNRKN
jgi:hypothetical protein